MKKMLAVLSLLLFVAVGCNDVERVKAWCATYNVGFNYVQAFAFPALDEAIHLRPDWEEEYIASKAALLELNEQLVSLCVRFETGGGITLEDVATIIAEATPLVARIIELYRVIVVDGFGTGELEITERDFLSRDTEIEALLADLAKVQNEAESTLK